MTYYNEFDPRAAAWLRELAKAGEITGGTVDVRSITDLQPADLDGYERCHFFAGIGGWDLALHLAGWPADVPVWTGSCPCQPFSCAGKRKAQADDRHLWPAWFRLIRERRPQFIFGEQVASAIGHGWLDGIFADLEGEGFACGAAVLGAHSVGAPHIRQRLYWVAYLPSERFDWRAGSAGETRRGLVETGCATGGVADTYGDRRPEHVRKSRGRNKGPEHAAECAGPCGLADTYGQHPRISGNRTGEARSRSAYGHDDHGCAGGLGNAARYEQRRDSVSGAYREGGPPGGPSGIGGLEHAECGGREIRDAERAGASAIVPPSAWGDYRVVPCADGKARRIESSFQCVVDGVSADMESHWDVCIKKIQEEVDLYAKSSETRPREVLRALRGEAVSQILQRDTGRHGSFHAEALLLIALCKLERKLGGLLCCETPHFSVEQEGKMREVWSFKAPACSPRGREFSKQLTGKLADIMCELPQEISPKITYPDPLAYGIPGRAGLLRGYGNAIVPQVAAAFVSAFMECLTPNY